MGIGNIFWQLIVGLIVGVLARLILPGREAFPEGALGWVLTALLGIAGAFLGSVIARTLWAGDNYAVGWIMSILGAILLLVIVRLIFGRGNTTTV
ncbi:MAG: GlsB/YeaQ/YmgE family stress response membrane protein [Blastocatellia bacterium]|nr:GlsB/YeaQ/YmgE family stress response membrane protein [Blastocatellia bacterium]